MPGLGIKQVLQATPVGYLVEMEDGQQRTFPENVLVEAGYVNPTQGLYAQPQQPQVQVDPNNLHQQLPRVNELGVTSNVPPIPHNGPAAAPAQLSAPAGPALAPTQHSQRVSASSSESGQQLVRRTDVGAPPPAFDDKPYLDAMQQAQGAVDAGIGKQRAAIDAAAAAETGRSAVEQQSMRDQAAQMERDRAERGQFDGVVQEYVQRKTAELNEKIARVPQEDPGKIWADNNAFQNAAGLLAAGLGGMLAVSTGSGRNMGLEAVERAIDRSINAQRTNIENEWKKIAHDKDSLQQYQAWKSQERGHLLESQIYHLEALKLNRLAEAEKYMSDGKKAELMGQAASLDVLSAEKQQALIKFYLDHGMAQANDAFNRYSTVEKLSLEKLNSAASRAASYANAEESRARAAALGAPKAPLVLSDRTGMTLGKDADGNTLLYQPRSQEEKDKLDGLGTTALNQHTILSAMREFLKTNPSSWSPEDRLRFASLTSQYIQSGGEKLGRMTDKDAELLRAQAGGDPVKFAQALTSLGASIKTIEDTMEANRSKYEIGAQQINRDIKVKLPDPDPVLLDRFGPQDQRYEDNVGNASAQITKAFSDTSSRSSIRKLEAVEALEASVTHEGTNNGELEIKKLDAAIKDLQKLSPAQRQIQTVDGSTQDALQRLTAIRQYVLNMQATGKFTGPMDRSQTLGTGVNVLDPVNPNRRK